MDKKIGFIGCGNMAKAMIGGIIRSGFTVPSNVYASNPSLPNLNEMKESFGIPITQNNLKIAEECDIVFLSVKPNMYPKVIHEIKETIKESTILILMAPGQSIEKNVKQLGPAVKLIRAMPNTPALIGEGMTAISTGHTISEKEKEEIKRLFECFGKVEFVDEKLMDAVVGVSGSSPAYVYMFIEALADGAVLQGMPRKQAYTFAAQAVLGAAKMVLETDIHPGQLKDMVCSPGGTTIEAVANLEENGFRSAVIEAVRICADKSEKMSR